MFKRKKDRRSLRSFLDALTVVVMVLVLFALPYAVTEVYGLKARRLILLMYLVVLAIFSVALSIWWLARYRQTSRDSDTKRLLDLKGGTPNIQDLGIHVLPCLREFGAESLMHM